MTGFREPIGFVTDAGISVYGPSGIDERNETYEVSTYAPGFTLIGDDSGGRGFLVRNDAEDSPVFSSDLGDLDPAGFKAIAPQLAAWVISQRP